MSVQDFMGRYEAFLESEMKQSFSEYKELKTKIDPESTPFLSKYKARTLLETLHQKFVEFQSEISCFRADATDSDFHGHEKLVHLEKKIQLQQLTISFFLAENYILTEEFTKGKTFLLSLPQFPFQLPENFIEESLFFSRRGYLYLLILNQLGIVSWSLLSPSFSSFAQLDSSLKAQIQTCFNYFLDAFRIYERLKSLDTFPFHNLEDLFFISTSPASTSNLLETEFTQTLFYLAQMYGKLGCDNLSAKYCKLTLRRQYYETPTEDFTSWCSNSAGLSTFYLLQADFPQALSCLLAASKMFLDHFERPSAGSELDPQFMDQRSFLFANMNWFWAKYFLQLLSGETNSDLESDDTETKIEQELNAYSPTFIDNFNCQIIDEIHPLDVYSQFLKSSLHRTHPDVILQTMPDHSAETLEEAKQIFRLGKLHFESALKYFLLDGYVTEHIELTQNFSLLYKNLVAFEPDLDPKCKLFKRRILLLEPIFPQLNPQFYLNSVRQLSYEIGECFHDLIDLKHALASHISSLSSSLVGSSQQRLVHLESKINCLVSKSALYFQKFIESFQIDSSTKIKQDFPDFESEELLVHFLTAHIHLARIFTKTIHHNPHDEILSLTKSQAAYRTLLEYAGKEKYQTKLANFQEQFQLCQEMSELVTQKLQNLQTSSFGSQ